VELTLENAIDQQQYGLLWLQNDFVVMLTSQQSTTSLQHIA